MKLKLVVTEPFSTRLVEGQDKRAFGRGDEITDADEMKAVLASHGRHVVKTAAEPPEGDPAFVKQTAEARAKPAALPKP